MKYKINRLKELSILMIFAINIFVLMVGVNVAGGEVTEGLAAELLRGLGLPIQKETDSEKYKIPRLDNASMETFSDDMNPYLPQLNNKLIESFSHPSWGGLGFAYRKNITIDSTKVPSDLTNYPLLIEMKEAFDIFGVTQASGNDVIFTDSSGNILDHEFERYEADTSHLVAWVNIPSLSSSVDTKISMYYGNETLSNQQNSTGVWDNDYMAVYHLNDDPSSTIYDSTSNDNDGSSYGTVSQEEGPMGNAYYFDQNGGTLDYLRIPQSSSISLSSNQMTLEGWVYLQFSPVPVDSMVFDKAGELYGTDGWMMGVDGGEGGTPYWNEAGYPTQLNQRINTVNNQNIRLDSGKIYPGKWTYVVVTYDGSSYTGYVDASSTTTVSISGNIRNVDMDLYIARRDEASNRMFYGSMDELRISDVARSTGYITTCFNNYNDPDAFYSITSQEPPSSDYEKQRTLTIDSSMVSGNGDLNNFPLLLDLYLENATPNIIFKDATTGIALSHEIELFDEDFNSSHDHLVVWVKIPVLSSTSDLVINMYTDSSLTAVYSNPSIWTDYTAVWHLGETVVDETSSNNVHEDSTSQSSDGDQHENDENQSIIGYGQSFDGTNDYIDMGDPSTLELIGDSYFTFTGWFYRASTTTDDYIIDKWDAVHGGSDGTGYYLWIDESDSGKLKFQSNDDDDDGFILASTSNFNTLPIGWYHYAITFHTSPAPETTSDLMQMYINGVDDNAVASLWGIGAPGWTGFDDFSEFTNTESFELSSSSSQFDGSLDEIRITEQILTEDWIKTEVRNQENLSAYLTVGSEIENTKLWYDDSFSRKKELKIDSTDYVGQSNAEYIILRPGARGTDSPSQWWVSGTTYKHEAVDEVNSDSWTSYITLSTNNTSYYRELFYASGLPATPPKGTITSVRVYSNARTSGIVTGYAFQHYLRVSGSTQYIGGRTLSGSWIVDYDEALNNPVTSQPWEWDDLDNLEFGVRGYVTEGASQGYLRVTQVWAVVTYEPTSSYLKDFPLTVDIYDSDLKSDVQTNGNDIRFYDQYGRKLEHEIVDFEQNYNTTHAHLSTWVNIPALSTEGDSYISMYYGNSTLGNQEQVTETWEDFLAVYHMEESPTTTVLDSTANNLDLTMSGSMNTGDLVTGKLDSSIEFDGTNDQLYTTQTITLGSFTISAWINFASGSGWNTILNIDRGISEWRQFSINEWDPRFDGASYSYAFGGPYSVSTWHQVTFTYNANTTEFKVFVDGVQSGSTRFLSIPDITDDFQIGAWGADADWWNGKLDELRIATDTRSVAWIKAEFASQNNPGTFISVGQEVELIPPKINSFGVDDPGNGNPTFWANVTDHDSFVSSVSLRINTSYISMTKNASGIWTYQLPSIMYGDYYTYQITNASDSSENYLKTTSANQDITFTSDSVLPTVIDWIYDPYEGVNGTFRANVSDSWGIIDTVLVNVTSHNNPNMGDLSSFWAVMRNTTSGYINNTLKMLSGSIDFVITVNDTGGNIFTSTEHPSFVINHKPRVTDLRFSLDPNPDNAPLLPIYSNSTAMYLHYNFTDVDDQNSESGSQIRWYKWNGTDWVLQGAYDDNDQIPRTALIKGDIWNVSVRPKDGIDFGDIVFSQNITIQNTVPLIGTPILSPSNPKTGNDISVSYTWIDADTGDTDQSLIRWYRDNHNSSGFLLIDSFTNYTLLPSSATVKGDTWKVNVTASDNYGSGNSIVSNEVTIINTAPTLEVDINGYTVPTQELITADLVANYVYFDADGDSINLTSLEYRWWKFNTTSNQFEINITGVTTIPSANTSSADLWRVEIFVNDGTDYSGWISSATISIGIQPNNPPSAIDVNLDLSNPVYGGFLYVNYTFTDIDVGDNNTVTLYRWYLNDVYQPQYDGYFNLSIAILVKGDIWYAEVRPRDEYDYGSWNQSGNITIRNTAPIVTVTEIFPTSPARAYTTNSLIANFEGTDVDGDLTNIFSIRWYNGGSHVVALDNETEVPSSYTTKGQLWRFEVSLFDGLNWSLSKTLTPVIIYNTKPSIENITITGGFATSDDITLDYDFVDVDGDLESTIDTMITWKIFHSPDWVLNDVTTKTLVSSWFTAGDLIYCNIVPSDGEDSGSPYDTSEYPGGFVVVGNTAPELESRPNILNSIGGTDFIANSILKVNYSTFDADSGENDQYDIELDGDGFVIGTNYRWYRNGVLVPALTAPTVPASYLVKGDNWSVDVQPRDRYGSYGEWNTSLNITIANSYPEISEVLFVNPIITTTSDVSVGFWYSDIDNDPIAIDNTSVLWYRNGVLIAGAENRTFLSSQLIGEDFYVIFVLNSIYHQRYDNISVSIQPFDGTDWASVEANSSVIQVRNTLPTAINLELLSNKTMDTIIYTTDLINFTWVFYDLDGETQIDYEIHWMRDDVIQSTYTNWTYIPSSATAKAEKWDAFLRVYDGTNYSIEQSITIRIANSIPTLIDVVLWNDNDLSNNTYSDGSISIYLYNFLDDDNDSLDETASYIRWYRNGVHYPEYDNRTSINSSYLLKGDYWYANVSILDFEGVAWSNSSTSQTIFVINKAPEVTTLLIVEGTDFVVEDQNITLQLTITDPDSVDLDVSIIQWFKNGDLQPQFNNHLSMPFSATTPGDNWNIIVIPSDGFDNGSIDQLFILIESRPQIQNLSYTPEYDTDGHFVIGLLVTDPRNEIVSVEYELYLNGSLYDPINNPDFANATGYWIFDYYLSNSSFYNTNTILNVTVESDIGIISTRTFNFTMLDRVAPRVSDEGRRVWFSKNPDINPTNLTFYTDIEEYGSEVASVILNYYYRPYDVDGEGSTVYQDDIEVQQATMIFLSMEDSRMRYSVTIDYPTDEINYEVIYWVSTSDSAGNTNEVAFDIRTDPDRIRDERISFQAPDISELVLLVAGVVIVLIFMGAIVYVRFIRKPEIVGLDKELVTKGVADVVDEQVFEKIDLHTLGVIVSFFDQKHGPVPIIVIPEMLKDNFDKLVALSDRSFSGTGFSEDFESETSSIYDFTLAGSLRIGVLSYGFALERPEARGGKENLTLNLLIQKEVSKLVSQFQDEIQEKAHEFHMLMAADSSDKTAIRMKANEVRKYVTKIILSYVEIYGSTELIEEET